MNNHIFAIMPVEMALDHRLNATHYRVLIALLSFRGKNTNLVWPSRSALSKRTGYTERTISRYTSQLEELGWLKKVGKGGRGMAVRYQITIPEMYENGCEIGDGLQDGNGCEPGHKTVANPGTKTVANYATLTIKGTEKEENEERKQSKRKKSEHHYDPVADMMARDIDEGLAKEFVAHRKAKRAQVTKRVIDTIEREAGKAGIDLEAALAECVYRGWTGFKAEWILNEASGGNSNGRQKSFTERCNEVSDAFVNGDIPF